MIVNNVANSMNEPHTPNSQTVNLRDLRRNSLQVALICVFAAVLLLIQYSIFLTTSRSTASYAPIAFTATAILGLTLGLTAYEYRRDRANRPARHLIVGLILTVDCLLLLPNATLTFYPYLYLIVVALAGFLISPLASFAVAFIGPLTGYLTLSLFSTVAWQPGALTPATVLSVVMATATWSATRNFLASYHWALRNEAKAKKRGEDLYESQQTLKRTNQILASTNRELAQSQRELQETRDELERLVADLQKLNRDKDKFFSIVAHDLKGPFMPLLGSSELLLEMHHSLTLEQVQELSASIHKSAKNVYNLLENLLEWARLQMGRMAFNPQTVNLEEIIQQNVDLFAEMADRKAIQLHSRMEEPLLVHADRYMLDTVIRNLTSNALKFTHAQGSVTLRVRRATTHDPPMAHISVVDTGVGIDEASIEKLFKLEVHHSTVGTGKEQGTGLGFLMCKEMVEQNGGHIDVTSVVGEGTTVSFTMPLSPQ